MVSFQISGSNVKSDAAGIAAINAFSLWIWPFRRLPHLLAGYTTQQKRRPRGSAENQSHDGVMVPFRLHSKPDRLSIM
jgi:hypothetical protein